MNEEEKKTENSLKISQTKSKEVLIKILNNVGIIGACICAIADIILTFIFVFGVTINISMKATIIYAILNAIVGLMITVLLRYQGIKYAEEENKELVTAFYRKEIKTKKKMSIGKWMLLHTLLDVAIKGGSTAFTLFGVIFLTIEGTKNPIQILMTIVTLLLFACFGLLGLSSSYNRYYNTQVPYMQEALTNTENEKKSGVEESIK